MSDDIDDRLEEFISSLNIIREQLEQTTHTASSSAVDNIKDPDGGADEESSSIALEEYLANSRSARSPRRKERSRDREQEMDGTPTK